jgi:translocation protein SEC63
LSFSLFFFTILFADNVSFLHTDTIAGQMATLRGSSTKKPSSSPKVKSKSNDDSDEESGTDEEQDTESETDTDTDTDEE